MKEQRIVVGLAGNPNVGKSAIFNTLTGGRQHVGNWPGKTIGRAEGVFFQGDWEIHLVDLRDLLQGILLGMDRPEAVGEVFTLGAGRPLNWEEAIPYLSEKLDVPYVEATVPPAGNRAFDISKIRERLGYDPKHDLASMVELALKMQQGEQVDVIPTGQPYA